MHRTLDDAASFRPWIDSSGRYRAKQEREQRERRRQILAPSDRVLLLLSPRLSARVKREYNAECCRLTLPDSKNRCGEFGSVIQRETAELNTDDYIWRRHTLTRCAVERNKEKKNHTWKCEQSGPMLFCRRYGQVSILSSIARQGRARLGQAELSRRRREG